MYIRNKKRSNGKISMQLVENIRVNGKPRQKVIRHVGTVDDNQEDIKELEKFAHYLKRQIEEELQPSLFSTDEADLFERRQKVSEDVKLCDLEEEERKIVGFHDVYGSLFDELGYNKIFGGIVRNNFDIKLLKDIVISRIANPLSKRASVSMLEAEFGINIDLEKVYKMMDKIDESAIDKIKNNALNNAKSLLGEEIDVIFYDATTLYFESFKEDALRQKGYSKDMKFNQTQILLTVLASKEGLPIGYDVFEGSFYEGHTLVKALDTIKKNYNIKQVIFVADSGLLNKDNLKLLEDNNYSYIIGAREKNTKKEIQEQILDSKGYEPLLEGITAKEIDIEDKRLISCYSQKRAYKDQKDRVQAIEELTKKLTKSKNSKSLISNYGYKKYLNIENSTVTLNEEKILQDQKWDGIFTIVTNNKKLTSKEVVIQYKSLWQIEETFRISKHNLRFRPIYHHKPSRIKAHIAICFIALTLVRNLMHLSRLQYKNFPPIQINNALKKAALTILRDKKTNKLYALPSKINNETLKLYQITKQKWTRTAFALNKR